MNVLITGNLAPISHGFIQKINEECNCVLYSNVEKQNIELRNVTVYKRTDDEDEMERVFSTFDFHTILYFSQALDGAVKIFDELEKLERTLYLCRRMKTENFIYITTNDLQLYHPQEIGLSRSILMESCENLCKSYSENTNINVLIARVPYLYSMKEADNSLQKWLSYATQKKHVEFRGIPEHQVDFLCDEDLGELIARVLDEPVHKNFEEANLSGDNEISFGELEKSMQKLLPHLECRYGNHADSIPGYLKNDVARTEYGWFPRHDLEADLENLIKRMMTRTKQQKAADDRREKQKRIHQRFGIFVDTIILFIIAEALNFWTKDNVLVNFIDFRLVFVILMGTVNGINAGVFAAILASFGYVFQSASATQWQVLFYNVQNWLPFACYFLLGSVCGYNRDRHDDEIRYAKEEQEFLENKYIFLNKLYQKVLDIKDNFNSQIIGYKDSFGKLYSIVKRLDSVVPEQIFFEAVSVLEDALENNNVAIYTIHDQSNYARLNVCSQNLSQTLGKSIKLSDYPMMMEQLKADKCYINSDCKKEYPAYAAPIFRNDKLFGMILLMHTQEHQMSMEFLNKFNIISDLVQDSLIRAMKFEDLSDRYIPHTQILMPEAYEQVLEVKEQMREKQYMEYVLLNIMLDGRSVKEIGELICGMVRANDTLGTNKQGELFLLLSQTRPSDIEVIKERMHKHNINFEVVKE